MKVKITLEFDYTYSSVHLTPSEVESSILGYAQTLRKCFDSHSSDAFRPQIGSWTCAKDLKVSVETTSEVTKKIELINE